MINLKRKKPAAAVPISAMSDISFILLIFIMLLALINDRKEVKIEYPEAQIVERTEAEDNLEIWVSEDGTITVDGKAMTVNELEFVVAQAVTETPGVRIHILADKNTPYRNVDRVVKVLQTLQHRVVSFVVKEE